ncbi:MAG: outer membrane beta-barrel protein [Ignavibacteria bacterium]|nr:outer membrane beta-barrel protein [Ignavibacteria bacterium]
MKRYINALILSFTLLGILVSSADAQIGRGKFGIGLSLAGNMLQSDWKTNDPGFGASADFSYALGSNWGLVSKLGLNTFTGKNTANQSVLSTVFYGNIGLSYDFLPANPLNPFLFGRVGLAFYTPRIDNGPALTSGAYQMWDMAIGGGIGVDYFIDESWSLIIAAEAGMLTNDQIDGYKAGGSNDISGQVSVGIRYYLFDRKTVERIVETVRR